MMKIQVRWLALALSAIASSCGTVSEGVGDGGVIPGDASVVDGLTPFPAPAGEMALQGAPVAPPFVHLPAFESASVNTATGGELAVGRFEGDLVLDQKRLAVRGAGLGQTVIDGDLMVGSQCRVSGLTVTGDVIFTGNNARVTVECLGQVLDYGMCNQYQSPTDEQ